MLIICPNCATSYNVDAATLGGSGRSVRCVRCRSIWQATATPERTAAIAGAKAGRAAPEPPPPPPPVAPPPFREEIVAAEPPPDGDIQFEEPPAAADPAEPPPMIDVSPPLVPTDLDGGRQPEIPADEPPPREDIEAIAARRAARDKRNRKRRSFAPPVAFIIVALIAIHGALLLLRNDVVRALPQTASLYAAIGLPVNLRGLVFDELKTAKEAHDGVAVLSVEGVVVNKTKAKADVPRLRFSVRNEAGQEIYSWTALPTKTALASGEALPFRTRLASPPAEGRTVAVRFFTRRDLVAGFQ